MKINRLLFLCFPILFASCNGQGTETYWQTKAVTKEDGSVMTGITLAYMEAIAAMNIHVSRDQDSLIFYYPYEKRVRISDLESLTGYRLKETGELLDSIYEVSIEDGLLKLKFHYIGTAKKDNRFSLNLAPLNKEDFLGQVTRLETERKQVWDKVKPAEISKFDLSIPKPGYFNEKDLTALSPMQGLEEFLGVENDVMQPMFRTFEYRSDTAEIKFNHLGVKAPVTDPLPVAKFSGIDFSELEFIVNQASDKTEAIILVKEDLDKKALLQLFDIIDTEMAGSKITYQGLPERLSDNIIIGIESSISLSWKSSSKVIKLFVEEIPDELYEAESDKGVEIPVAEEIPGESIKKVFRHYLDLVEEPKVLIFIVSEELDSILEPGDYPAGAWGNIENYGL